MTLTEAKLKAVRDWSKPQNIKDFWSFLGFANYYRRFVKNFDRRGGSIEGFDQERSTMVVGTISAACLLAVKGHALCIALVLLFPDPKLRYTVVIDASRTTAGGVLMQD